VAGSERFPPEKRLRRRSDFERVFRRGRRLDGPYFLLIVLANGGRADRLGVTVSRKVGNATRRNRARRLVRESFRRREEGPGPTLDLVLVVKKGIVGLTREEVDRELGDRLRRVAGPAGSRRAPAPARP
jgi:ribonuclease P protein component